jgi:Tfp pilus assembly protein PilN
MTPRFHLSLIAPGVKSLALTQRILTYLTLCCLGLTGGLWWYGQELDQQTSSLQTQIEILNQTNQQLMIKADSLGFDLSDNRRQELPKEVTFVNTIRTHQNFSWTQFLNDLEATVPEKISMDSVTLNFKDATIALQGSAGTLKDLNVFVDELENHPAFHHVVLSRHSQKSKKKNKKHQFVVFTMKVSYEPIRT